MTMFNQSAEDLENEYLQELADDIEMSQPRFTDTFLIEAFPDAIDDFDDNITELKAQQKMLVKQIKEWSEPYVSREDIDAFFALWCIKHFLIAELVAVEKNLYLIQRLRRKKNAPKRQRKQGLTDEDIEKARNVSIVQIAETNLGQLRKMGKTYTSRCPFHQDKTPSFTLYPDSNRYYCYGCHASGDSIAFVQKLFNYDFKTAIYFLIRK